MKVLIHLIIWGLIVLSSIVTMIYGWGLTPVNWGWIAFGYVSVCVLPAIQLLLTDK